MNKLIPIVTLCLTVLFPVNARAQTAVEVPPGVDALVAGYTSAYATLDSDLMATLFLEEAVHISSFGTTHEGRSAIHDLYTQVFATLAEADVHPEIVEFRHTGDWGFARVNITADLEAVDGRTVTQLLVYYVVVKKVDDDSWRVYWDMPVTVSSSVSEEGG
jgi:uncharacterized protein (TIGR02246 family)